MPAYPNREEILEIFKNLSTGTSDAFLARVAEDVNWTVMGTHPLAGVYTSRQAFTEATFARLGAIMKPPGIQMGVRNIIGGGDQAWAVVELVANAVCKDDFQFENCYAWCLRFNEKGIIVEVRAYLDSWMVRQALIQNEMPSQHAPVPNVHTLKPTI